MKIITALISIFNLYIGFRFFLNVIQVLQTTKYSKVSTAIFALLFLSMGIAGLYFCFIKDNNKKALLIGMGPWILGLMVLLVTMLTSDYK